MARLSLVESLRKARSTESLKEAGSIAREVRDESKPKSEAGGAMPHNGIHSDTHSEPHNDTTPPTTTHPTLHRSTQRHNGTHNGTTPPTAKPTTPSTTKPTTKPTTAPTTPHATPPTAQPTTRHEPPPPHPAYVVTDKVAGLSGKKAEIFANLVANRLPTMGGCAVVNLKKISITTQISYNTVRAAMCDFHRLRFIDREDFRNGSYQGVKITFLNKSDERFLSSRSGNPTTGYTAEYTTTTPSSAHQLANENHTTYPTAPHTTYPATQTATGCATPSTAEYTAQPTTCSKIDRSSLNTLSIQNTRERLRSLTDQEIIFHWPALASIGFNAQHVGRILDSLDKVGREPDGLVRAFDYIEFELNNGGIKSKDGEPVKSPAGYVFNALAKTGRYRRPPTYVSPEELAEQERQEDLRRIIELRKQTEELEFESWKTQLSPSELAEVRKNMRGPEEQWMRYYWRKNVKDAQS